MSKDKIDPIVSIITVVYNGEKYLEETIQSVICQTYDNLEYIIIDGGSTDGTIDIIKKYEDKIDYWVSEKDDGIYDAMNKGIEVARGQWINFMNASDAFVNKDVLVSLEEDFKNEKLDLIYGKIILRDENQKIIANVTPKNFTRFNLIIFGTGTLCHQSMFVNRRVVVKYNLLYSIKGELNWYFDLIPKVKNYLNKELDIVNYSLGGFSENMGVQNLKELTNLMMNQNHIFGVFHLPFLFYSYLIKFYKKMIL